MEKTDGKEKRKGTDRMKEGWMEGRKVMREGRTDGKEGRKRTDRRKK